MRRRDRTLIFLIIFAVLGMAMAMQFRSILSANRQKALTVYKQDELKALLEQEKETGRKLKASMDEAQKKNEAYVKSIFDDKNDEKSEKERAQLQDIQLKGGLTDVKGAGVEVRLNDAKVRPVENPNLLLIHDMDIVKVLNELKKAGAQAISVNGQRIIASSEQICAGPTIRVNGARYAVPFIIKAIGDPDTMYDGLQNSGIMTLLLDAGIGITIDKSKDMTISKYSGPIDSLITGLEVTDNENK